MTTITARNQAEVDARVPEALRAGGEVELRIDPMEGPIDARHFLACPLCDGSGQTVEEHDYCSEILGCPCEGKRLIARVTIRGGGQPVHPAWVMSLRDQCSQAGVPFVFESWGEWEAMTDADGFAYYMATECEHEEVANMSKDVVLMSPDGKIQVPLPTGAWWTLTNEMMEPEYDENGDDLDFGWGSMAMHRVGSTHSGRMLDGRTHDGEAT